LVRLRKDIAETRTRRARQLKACESGRFLHFWMDEQGRRVDVTADQIAEIKRQIAEYDRLIAYIGP
jgi:hypothetical protein